MIYWCRLNGSCHLVVCCGISIWVHYHSSNWVPLHKIFKLISWSSVMKLHCAMDGAVAVSAVDYRNKVPRPCPSYVLSIPKIVFKIHTLLCFAMGLILVDISHILQGYFTGTGAIIWLPQCQWSNPGEYRCKNTWITNQYKPKQIKLQ